MKHPRLVLTALPARTHLRHGRAGSHPRCFFLQFTQADATWALVLRVDFCADERVVGPDADDSSGGNGYAGASSGLGEPVCGDPSLGGICTETGSHVTGRGCAVAVVAVDSDDDATSAVVVGSGAGAGAGAGAVAVAVAVTDSATGSVTGSVVTAAVAAVSSLGSLDVTEGSSSAGREPDIG